MYVIGIDVGGTFTDCALIDLKKSRIFTDKASTTPKKLRDGVFNSLANLATQMKEPLERILSEAVFIGHGTTVGTNALITRSGSSVGLITTKGFEDTIYIQRGVGKIAGLTEDEIKHRTIVRQPQPLVPKNLIVGVPERIDCFGNVIFPLQDEDIKEAINYLLSNGAESVAVCLLWSFVNTIHEEKIRHVLQNVAPDIPVSVSSELAPKLRENSRSNTVIINAYIDKVCKQYLKEVTSELKGFGFRHNMATMQVFGGVTDSELIDSISTINSGPVGGVMGAKYLGKALGFDSIITTDMGGTSFDVSVIHDGKELIAREYFGAPGVIARFETLVPRVDIKTIGAGGGTIAWVDKSTNTIKVGPNSAGADPGPVFYDKGGTEPTVSDVDMILGYLNEDFFFGGRMKVNKEKAHQAIQEKIAAPLGMEVVDACIGVFDIVNNMMSDSIRGYLVEKGYDPTDFMIFAFGGAGPVHASSYAEIIGVKKCVIPLMAPAFSAFGIAVSDIIHKKSISMIMPEPFDAETINDSFLDLEKKILKEMDREGIEAVNVSLRRSIDVKYSGQIHELTVSVPTKKWNRETVTNEIKSIFMENYEGVYGKGAAYTRGGAEIVAFNVDAIGELHKPRLKKGKKANPNPERAVKSFRDVYFKMFRRYVNTPIYDLEKVQYGNVIEGPAILESPQTTVVIPPDQKGLVDGFRNVIIEF